MTLAFGNTNTCGEYQSTIPIFWFHYNSLFVFLDSQFCMELNGLAVHLQTQCFPQTCNQMTATEQWIFLCAAHKTPKECPAIDYTRHTLDGAACLLNSYKYFPSRYIQAQLNEIIIYLKQSFVYSVVLLSRNPRWLSWDQFAVVFIASFRMLTSIIVVFSTSLNIKRSCVIVSLSLCWSTR